MKSKNQNPFLVAAITLAGFAFGTPAAFAASPYTWTPTANGTYNWNNASTQNNWGQGTASFPNAIDDVANMNIDIAANQTVNLNQAITVGSLTIGDSSGAQTETLAAGTSGSLTFDVTSGNASLIRTATGTGTTPTISAPITLNDNLAVSLASGSAISTMTLSGIISESGGAKSLTKDGSTLTLVLQGANTFSGGVTILSGTVDSKTSTTTLGSGTLVIGGTGGVNPIFQTGQNNSNAVQVNANTTGTSIIASNDIGSGTVMSGAITLNTANLNVRTFNGGTTASVTLSGGVTGTGNLLINNLSNGASATGKVTLSGATINNIGTVTSQGTGPTANVISAVIGANVTGVVVQNAITPLNLAAANLYTGPTTINTGGTFVLGHANAASNSSAVTIADTGALSLTTTPSTVKMLTFSATGKLNFDVAGGGTGLTVSTSNGVTNSGAAGSVTINITGSAPTNGTYPLISYSGTLQGSGFSAYTLGTKPPGKSYALNNAAGVVQLVVSDLPAIQWTGAQSTEWSTAAITGSKNWKQGASPVDYTDGQAVLFEGTATGYTVDLSVADVTPLNVTFDNNGATPYTLQGSKAITGSTALTKSGSQTLTITNSNTYTGATIINAGKLEIGGTSLLGALGTYAGAITIADGATFEKSASGSQTLSGAVTGLGTLKMSASGGGITLNNSGNGYGALEITAGRVFISDSALALPAAATVSITNTSLLVFNTSGTYNNTITVGNNGGICSRNSSGATLNNVTLPGTGTVIFNNDDSATRLLTISTGQTLTGDLTVQISGNRMTAGTTQLGAVTLSGILTGSGGLTLVSSGNPLNTSLYGTGTLTLTNANNYNGPTTIKSGKLVLDGAANRLATTAAVALGDTGTTAKIALGGTTAASQTLTALTTTGLGGSVVGGNATSSMLTLNIASSNTFGGILGGVGTNENNLALTKTGVGTLTLSNTANTFTGQVLSDSGTIQVIKLENNGTASSVGSGTGSIRLGNNATATLEYIGTTDSSTNKVIQIGTNAASNTGSAAIFNNSASGKLTFTATTFNQVVGAATVARPLTLGGTYTGAANEITGVIQDHNTAGGGIVSLIKEGASTWALSGANTYTGNTSVTAGTLALADNAQLKFVLGATSGVNNGISGAGTVTLDGDFVIDTAAADALPSGTWTIVNNSTLTETYGATFTVAGFTDAGSNKWTKVNGSKLYTFDEATGILTLASAASYASWIDSFFPGETNPAIIGAGADPENDGIDNGVEMVIGGNPATGMDTALLPTLELVTNPVSTPAIPAGDYLLFTYRRSDLSVAAGVTATCETDTDLVGPWTVATDGVSGTVIQVDDNFTFTPPAAANTDRVRVYVPRGANTTLFGRLAVQVP